MERIDEMAEELSRKNPDATMQEIYRALAISAREVLHDFVNCGLGDCSCLTHRVKNCPECFAAAESQADGYAG